MNKKNDEMNISVRSQIKPKEKIIGFMRGERVSSFATIDKNGFPFVAAMNFVYYNDSVYLHGFPKGEKYENMKLNAKCGFEVSR